MLEWFVYVMIIAFFFGLMITGWIVYAYVLFLGYLVLAFIAEVVLTYQKYKDSIRSKED